ncbi:MAG: Calx-beta domain-containing protein, partial [Planctomycetota bacterium]|nr:Calx-beta domain-containing protein [Planctomycetota bacterium]
MRASFIIHLPFLLLCHSFLLLFSVDYAPITFEPDRHSGLRGYAEHLYLARYPSRLPPASDTYTRYTWRQLETAPGVFDFSIIDQDLANAAAAGRKHAFRVYCVTDAGQTVGVPQYIVDQGLGQWGSGGVYVPFWNDSRVISAMQRLMQALGQRYDNDPRLSFIDFGLYGRWGEWHMAGLDSWLPRASLATRKQLVDIVVAAFPNTIKVMIPDSGETDGTLGQAFRYALEKDPKIGIRKDNLGNEWFDQEAGYTEIAAVLADRWKTAPFVTEFYGDWGTDLDRALEQALRHHVSLIGANIDHEKMVVIGQRSGYRYRIASAWWPSEARPGSTAVLTTKWFNDGIAPAYERWNIRYELWASSGTQAAYSKISTLDLRTLLPGSILHADELALPSSLAAGTYELRVVVEEQRGVRPPMHLAMQVARRSDGRYPLGSISVSAQAPTTPSASVTMTASAATVHESGGSATLIVQRSGGDQSLPLVVNFTLSGTAQLGVDYRLSGAESAGTNGMILIPAQATQAQITIEPLQDAAVENVETIGIALANGVGYTIATSTTATVLLADDDVVGSGIIAQDSCVYATSPQLSAEHNGGFGWADRWYGYGSLVDGGFSRAGLITQGAVHIETNGLWGRVGRTLAQPVPNGAWVAFLAQLKGWSPAIIEFKSSTDPLSQLDSQTLFRLYAGGNDISLTAANDVIQGGGSGWKMLPGVSRGEVQLWVFRVANDRVDLYVNPDLTSAQPPAQPTASLTLAELGNRSPLFRSISLFSEYKGDVLFDEFRVANSWSALAGQLKPTVVLHPSSVAIVEGQSAAISVIRNGSLSGTLTVAFSYGGTATASSDYTAVASLTIPANAASASLSLNTIADGVAEGAETIVISVAANAAYSIGSPASCTVTVTDTAGSALPVLSITASDAQAAEGSPADTGTFTITRDATAGALTVAISVSGTASAGSDYTALPTSVNFT